MMNDVLGGDVDGRVERLAESAVRFLGQFGKCVGGKELPHVSGDKMPSEELGPSGGIRRLCNE